MKKILLMLFKYMTLFVIFGTIYIVLELLFRGYSHWTMFICGGVSAMEIGLLNEVFEWKTPMWQQLLCGSLLITLNEFITGITVNICLNWNVWDYSDMPFNILGQICLPFMGLWFVLSYLAIILDDYLRWKYFNEQFPHYNYKFK